MVSENTLITSKGEMRVCLNPCFNGIWSLSANVNRGVIQGSTVLILVLMEYGL